MKQTLAIVLYALLFAASSLAGCAGAATQIPATNISDKSAKGDMTGGATAAVTTEKPIEKAYVDQKGQFEIISTPFGYVKREIKQTEKESSAPATVQPAPAIPVTEVVKAPAAPPVQGTGPASPAPVQPAPAAPLAPAVKAPAAPPAQGTEPAKPAPVQPEKSAEKKAPESAGQISLDFDDADLYAVIKTMADFLKINYIIDPGVSGKVTIHTAGRLKEEDLFPIFYQTLEVNGLTAVKERNVYRILKLKDAPRMPITSRLASETKDIPPEERIIIQIIPLKFISAPEMTKVISPFVSADGAIISEGVSNTLLVVDKGINILKVLRLVEVFDVSVFERMKYRFYTLQNMGADEAVKLLREVLTQAAGVNKDDVRFIPLSRLNALLVVSPSPDVFGRVDAFIRQLDVPSEGAQPQIHIYSVKNGMATELGDTLKSIFGKNVELRKDVKRESVPTNPFGTVYTTTTGTPVVAPTAPSVSTAPPVPAAPPTSLQPDTSTTPAVTETGASLTLRGTIRITVDPIRNALIIEAIPRDYQIVERILGRLDVLPRQVLIEVIIAEIQLGQGTELGIEWTFKKDPWIDSGPLSATIGASGLQYAIGLSQKWQAALHAAARDSKVNILSSPSILASDNKPAKIDVTTEVPIPSTSYTIQSVGAPIMQTTVAYRNTGVILDVTPHINEHGLVTMEVTQEVSNIGELLKVAGMDYYSFNKRQVKTSLTVKHNQSIVIGGLIMDSKNAAASGVPWLVKIPLLRWLFGTESTNISKSELILMITPRVITTLDDVDAVSDDFKKKIGAALQLFK